jgi:hypothetical protein
MSSELARDLQAQVRLVVIELARKDRTDPSYAVLGS